MAERKPLFMDQTEGFMEEMATSDSMTLGGLAMGGNISMGTNKVTGLGAATASGDAISYGQSSASLAGLTLTADLAMGTNKITGLAPGTAGTDAVNKNQLDAVSAGITWKEPALVLKMVSDADQSGAPPSASAGDAYVVNNWGGGYTDGDIVEYDGASWNVILDEGGAGEPADGTIVIVTDGTAAGSFATKEEQVATYDATGDSWSFTVPDDGDARLIVGEGSVYENEGFVWDATPGVWVQFTALGNVTAGAGLLKTGNTLDVRAGDGIEIASDYVAIDLEALGAGTGGLRLVGTTPSKELGVKPGDGILLDANGVGVDIAASNPGLQLTGSSPDKELAVLVNTAAGLDVTASGVEVDLAAAGSGTGGLEFDGSGDVQVKVSGSEGIVLTATGVAIEIDDTPDTLDVDGDGLKVVGLPSLFKINDVAVGATVTAANLDDLTDGSNADSLHTHATSAATEAPKVENTLTTATDTTANGDPVYINGSATVGKSLANDNTKARVLGVIRTGGAAAPASVEVVSLGICAGVLSSATPGTPYYLQAAGGIGTSLPGAGNRVIQVGWAYTADDLWVELKDFGKKAA